MKVIYCGLCWTRFKKHRPAVGTRSTFPYNWKFADAVPVCEFHGTQQTHEFNFSNAFHRWATEPIKPREAPKPRRPRRRRSRTFKREEEIR